MIKTMKPISQVTLTVIAFASMAAWAGSVEARADLFKCRTSSSGQTFQGVDASPVEAQFAAVNKCTRDLDTDVAKCRDNLRCKPVVHPTEELGTEEGNPDFASSTLRVTCETESNHQQFEATAINGMKARQKTLRECETANPDPTSREQCAQNLQCSDEPNSDEALSQEDFAHRSRKHRPHVNPGTPTPTPTQFESIDAALE